MSLVNSDLGTNISWDNPGKQRRAWSHHYTLRDLMLWCVCWCQEDRQAVCWANAWNGQSVTLSCSLASPNPCFLQKSSVVTAGCTELFGRQAAWQDPAASPSRVQEALPKHEALSSFSPDGFLTCHVLSPCHLMYSGCPLWKLSQELSFILTCFVNFDSNKDVSKLLIRTVV